MHANNNVLAACSSNLSAFLLPDRCYSCNAIKIVVCSKRREAIETLCCHISNSSLYIQYHLYYMYLDWDLSVCSPMYFYGFCGAILKCWWSPINTHYR